MGKKFLGAFEISFAFSRFPPFFVEIFRVPAAVQSIRLNLMGRLFGLEAGAVACVALRNQLEKIVAASRIENRRCHSCLLPSFKIHVPRKKKSFKIHVEVFRIVR